MKLRLKHKAKTGWYFDRAARKAVKVKYITKDFPKHSYNFHAKDQNRQIIEQIFERESECLIFEADLLTQSAEEYATASERFASVSQDFRKKAKALSRKGL